MFTPTWNISSYKFRAADQLALSLSAHCGAMASVSYESSAAGGDGPQSIQSALQKNRITGRKHQTARENDLDDSINKGQQ